MSLIERNVHRITSRSAGDRRGHRQRLLAVLACCAVMAVPAAGMPAEPNLMPPLQSGGPLLPDPEPLTTAPLTAAPIAVAAPGLPPLDDPQPVAFPEIAPQQPAEKPMTGSRPRSDSSLASLAELQAERQRRVAALRLQIEALHRACLAECCKDDGSALPTVPGDPVTVDAVPAADGSPATTAAPSTPADATDNAAPVAAPSAADSAALPAVVPGEVDRLALADSLFAAQQISAAYDIYQALQTASFTPEEQFWILSQRAACLRRSGDDAAAEKLYREIIAGNSEGWLGDSARWWLTTVDVRRRLEANSAKLADILDTLSAEADNARSVTP
ncbi:MAG: hypothetical protein R3B90_04615 [Planctomycetaceae bacterium]